MAAAMGVAKCNPDTPCTPHSEKEHE
ncbi:MAG: hypothetical protein QOK44_4841, partial [Betaproteobacteria bacterium]|nr:hypothetical protein [Betaproteobacteria bacterium]